MTSKAGSEKSARKSEPAPERVYHLGEGGTADIQWDGRTYHFKADDDGNVVTSKENEWRALESVGLKRRRES